MKTHNPKSVSEAINDLETFFHADLPSKIFPMERLTNQTWFREDFFETNKQVGKYVKEHFSILRKQIKKLEGNLSEGGNLDG